MSNPNNIDLELLRNNFVSIEYFNLEQKLKQFLLNSVKEVEDMQKRVNTLQLKVPERTVKNKEYIIQSLIKFDTYLEELKDIKTDLFNYIDFANKYGTDPVGEFIDNKKDDKSSLTEEEINTKPYKKRNPKPVPKPKKPRDLTE